MEIGRLPGVTRAIAHGRVTMRERVSIGLAAAAVVFLVLALWATHVIGSAARGPKAPEAVNHSQSVRIAHRVQLTAPGPVYWGALIQNSHEQAPWNMKLVSDFTNLTGKQLSIISWGSSFYSSPYCKGYCGFQTPQFDAVRAYGAIPLFSWAPGWAANVDARIAGGADDSYLRQWAESAKAWGHPFFLRFAWEMNGNWFPWGVLAEHNSPASYVAMWRHVHDIFTSVGATNVTWVWCPNINAPGVTYSRLADLYPGDKYVDWTCLDGYNGDTPWTSFSDLYRQTYQSITQDIAPGKPMLLGEVSSTETGGSKANWITDMFQSLPTVFPMVRALIWWESSSPGPGNRTDWPIESSPGAETAFTAGIDAKPFTSNTFSHLDKSPIPPPS